MRVLGIDPGLTRLGLGVVEGQTGRGLRMIAVGVARTPADQPLEQRLCHLDAVVEEWVHEHRPDVVAVERMFAQHNVSTVIGTAQASAVAMVAAARLGIPVALHTPSEVKAAISGNGRADKKQVTAMVTRHLRLTEAPKPADAADALALAITHVWRGAAQSRLADAARAAGAAPGQAGGTSARRPRSTHRRPA